MEGKKVRINKKITGFEQVFPTLSKPLEKFTQNVFGKELELFKGNEFASSLLERFYSLALDSGIRKSVEFKGQKLPPVAIFNRQAFLSQLRERIVFKQTGNDTAPEFTTKKDFRLFHIDIENLRSADEAKEGKNNAADYNLNLVVSSLNTAAEEIKSKFNINAEDILVGRYGGDEFDIGLVGDYKQSVIIEIKKIILDDVEKNTGWFKIDGKIGQKSVKVKDGNVEEIKAPITSEDGDPTNKRIFFSFLKRGMVLNEDQIRKERDSFITSDKLNEDELNRYLNEVLAKDIYPDNIKEDDIHTKINHLTNKNSELVFPFYLAEELDRQARDINNTRQEKLLKFVEDSLFDPLLDEVVVSKPDLKERIEKGKYDTVYNFEIKLKEINDFLNYSTGDRTIISLWKGKQKEKGLGGLRDILKTYLDEDKIDVSRFGGALYVCVKKGVVLDSKELRRFAENGVDISYHGEASNYAVGYSETDLKKTNKNERKVKTDEIMNSVKVSKDWFNKVLTKLVLEPDSFDLFVNLVNPGPLQTPIKQPFEITKKIPDYISIFLYGRYFTEKRWRKRITEAEIYAHLDVTQSYEKIPVSNDIYERAENLQNLLVAFYGDKYYREIMLLD